MLVALVLLFCHGFKISEIYVFVPLLKPLLLLTADFFFLFFFFFIHQHLHTTVPTCNHDLTAQISSVHITARFSSAW